MTETQVKGARLIWRRHHHDGRAYASVVFDKTTPRKIDLQEQELTPEQSVWPLSALTALFPFTYEKGSSHGKVD